LEKLIEISERKDLANYSNLSPSYKKYSVIEYNNPQRKKRQQEILETNNRLARKLQSKESEFDRNKIIKTIEEYESIKKILSNNRRVKLYPMERENGGYNMEKIVILQNAKSDYQMRRFKSEN
jgi:hypothetical protein